MSADLDECPNCGVSLQGEPIPQESVARGLYGDSTHWRREIGCEVPGVYDGVLYWMCPDCEMAWPRWFGTDHRARESNRHVALHNFAVKEDVS